MPRKRLPYVPEKFLTVTGRAALEKVPDFQGIFYFSTERDVSSFSSTSSSSSSSSACFVYPSKKHFEHVTILQEDYWSLSRTLTKNIISFQLLYLKYHLV